MSRMAPCRPTRMLGFSLTEMLVAAAISSLIAIGVARFVTGSTGSLHSMIRESQMDVLFRSVMSMAGQENFLRESIGAKDQNSNYIPWFGTASVPSTTEKSGAFRLVAGGRLWASTPDFPVRATIDGRVCPAGSDESTCPIGIRSSYEVICGNECRTANGIKVTISFFNTKLGTTLRSGTTAVSLDAALTPNCPSGLVLTGLGEGGYPLCSPLQTWVPTCAAGEYPIMQEWQRFDGSAQPGFRCMKLPPEKACVAGATQVGVVKGVLLPSAPVAPGGSKPWEIAQVSSVDMNPICDGVNRNIQIDFAVPNLGTDLPDFPGGSDKPGMPWCDPGTATGGYPPAPKDPNQNTNVALCDYPNKKMKEMRSAPEECTDLSQCQSITFACDSGKGRSVNGVSPVTKDKAKQMCDFVNETMTKYILCTNPVDINTCDPKRWGLRYIVDNTTPNGPEIIANITAKMRDNMLHRKDINGTPGFVFYVDDPNQFLKTADGADDSHAYPTDSNGYALYCPTAGYNPGGNKIGPKFYCGATNTDWKKVIAKTIEDLGAGRGNAKKLGLSCLWGKNPDGTNAVIRTEPRACRVY